MRRPYMAAVTVGIFMVTAAVAAPRAAGQDPAPWASAGAVRTPADYEYVAINYPGASRTLVFGINSVGSVVGRYLASGTWRGFVFDGVNYVSIARPGFVQTIAYGINTRGDIVGTSVDASGIGYGFILSNGEFKEIAIDHGEDVWVYDINDSGIVLGNYTDRETGAWINFLWRDGELAELATPEVKWAEGVGLNDRGQVAGHFVRANDSTNLMRGFVLDRGRFTEVEWPAANGMSCLQGIGDTGEAVGHVQLAAKVWGITWRSGRFTGMLQYPDARHTYPHAISPSGVIAGYYVDASGLPHGFTARATR